MKINSTFSKIILVYLPYWAKFSSFYFLLTYLETGKIILWLNFRGSPLNFVWVVNVRHWLSNVHTHLNTWKGSQSSWLGLIPFVTQWIWTEPQFAFLTSSQVIWWWPRTTLCTAPGFLGTKNSNKTHKNMLKPSFSKFSNIPEYRLLWYS